MIVPSGATLRAHTFSVWPRREKLGSPFAHGSAKMLITVSWPPVTAYPGAHDEHEDEEGCAPLPPAASVVRTFWRTRGRRQVRDSVDEAGAGAQGRLLGEG